MVLIIVMEKCPAETSGQVVSFVQKKSKSHEPTLSRLMRYRSNPLGHD